MFFDDEKLEEIWKRCEQYKLQQKKSEWMEFVELLNHINDRIPFENALEIGAYDGGCTIALSHFFPRIISVDAIEPARFKIDEISKNCNFSYIGKNSHLDTTFDEVKSQLNGDLLDLLFIDGDHSYEGSLKDYEMYSKLVKENGIIAFHDIVNSTHHRSQGCHVAKTWSKIKEKYDENSKFEIIFDEFGKNKCTFENSETAVCGGIGFIFNKGN